MTTVPNSGLSGNVFLTAVPYVVPANSGFLTGLNPVTWFIKPGANQAGISANWQWAAAVYTSFNTTNFNLIGVKPVDTSTTQYPNSDHAGTPENFKSFVIGGARGGGGSNFTGSYSGTGNFTTTTPPPTRLTNTATVTVSVNGTNLTASATATVIVALSSSVSGSVFLDSNNNKKQDNGEPSLGGVQVNLVGADLFNDPVSLTTFTLADGSYQFLNLVQGTYAITEIQPPNLVNGQNTVGSAGGNITTDGSGNSKFANIQLGNGASATGYTFAELPAASISGSVFVDTNKDGKLQAGEFGIGGVNLTLTGTDLFGNAVNLTVQTNSSGFFNFANLESGTYNVTETQPSGYTNTKTTAGTAGGNAGSNSITNITIKLGQIATTYYFGEIQSTISANSLTATISPKFRSRNHLGKDVPFVL